MYTILRNDICKTDPNHKRVYLVGATNEFCDQGMPEDPMVYTKIGLSQNPIERLPQLQSSYTDKHKEITMGASTMLWFPRNFTLMGYTSPLPFAASVETMAQKMLVELYKDIEALDVNIKGLKDWYRPTNTYHAAFCIFEAIKQCYKDSGVKKVPTIKWTIPTKFPLAGNSIITIRDEYLHYLNNFKKKNLDLTHFMYNSCGEPTQFWFPFNAWLKQKNIDMNTRRKYLQGATRFVQTIEMSPQTKSFGFYFGDKVEEEGVRVYNEEFLKDTAFLKQYKILPINMTSA